MLTFNDIFSSFFCVVNVELSHEKDKHGAQYNLTNYDKFEIKTNSK